MLCLRLFGLLALLVLLRPGLFARGLLLGMLGLRSLQLSLLPLSLLLLDERSLPLLLGLGPIGLRLRLRLRALALRRRLA